MTSVDIAGVLQSVGAQYDTYRELAELSSLSSIGSFSQPTSGVAIVPMGLTLIAR